MRSFQALRSLSEQRLVQEKTIQRHDDGGDAADGDCRHAMIDENAHQIAIAREDHQRDQGEWNTKREYHLADHESASRIESQGDHDERWKNRHAAPHPEWNRTVEKS